MPRATTRWRVTRESADARDRAGQVSWLTALGLVGLGVLVGTYGTLIGAGGGFVLVPVLLLLYPHDSPTTITSISLAVVFFNALSGSVAYARMRRIDIASGWRFALAAVPGAILGALLVGYLSRGIFDVLFAVILIALSLFILFRPAPVREPRSRQRASRADYYSRSITDAEGNTYTYAYNTKLGLALSALVGFLSSLLGIGGGVIHVPVLITILGFPAHVATATSHFVLAIMALAGTLVHIASGE